MPDRKTRGRGHPRDALSPARVQRLQSRVARPCVRTSSTPPPRFTEIDLRGTDLGPCTRERLDALAGAILSTGQAVAALQDLTGATVID